jgi:hypothetical protein
MLQNAKLVLAEAHAAAEQAVEEFLKIAPRSADGSVRDAVGFAFVIVYTPSYHLRAALKQLGEIERGYKGMWYVSHFRNHAKGPAWQSITAQEKACRAACEVLRKHFDEHGRFSTISRMD